MDSHLLFSIFVFLAATCIAVPISSRLKFGSVLGYLIAGIVIGPYGLGLIGNAEEIMHFAEFGVVVMLFLIGLELEPDILWRLRKNILGLGGLQVLITSAAFTIIGLWVGYSWQVSLAVAMALSLSSTALVLQMLEERRLTATAMGESAFSVLLLQDIAVIPILIILPLLASTGTAPDQGAEWFAAVPGWLKALIVLLVIFAMVRGAFLLQYLFRFIAKAGIQEVFTAIALALVVGITLLMQILGVSPALGAFIAGLVLANSEYKHMLETDLKPFKGLLLGIFFISVGMGMQLGLFATMPLILITCVVLLVLVKAAVLLALGRIFDLNSLQNIGFAIALAQGGEFAFVLFQYAYGLNLVSNNALVYLNLIVALSMALTPVLMALYARFIVPRFMSLVPRRDYDAIDDDQNAVIIAGYGRFGQVVGRFLRAQGVKTIILEKDPDQIDLLRKFGTRGYYGDASRLDLLRNAGAQHAKLLIIAVDDAEKCLEIAELAHSEFPGLKILARARNRRHAYELHKAGVDYFKRETFDSSLALAQEAMRLLGHKAEDVKRRARLFMAHDEDTLRRSFDFFEQEKDLISFSRQAAGEMENILRSDLEDNKAARDNAA